MDRAHETSHGKPDRWRGVRVIAALLQCQSETLDIFSLVLDFQFVDTLVSMWNKKLLLLGIVVAAFGFLFPYAIGYTLNDRVPPPPADAHGILKFEFNGSPPPFCNVTIQTASDRKVRLNRSFALNAKIWKNESDILCKVNIRVSAPAFDVKPDETNIELPDASGKTARNFAFNLMPQQAGPQVIIVEHGEDENQFGYSVYDYPLVPPEITFFFPIVSTVLGGMLTVPWWIEFFGKKRKNKKKK